MGTPVELFEESAVLSFTDGDRFNEWIIDRRILSIGYSGRNRAWRAHCFFCGWERVLHEATVSEGFVPRCINNCGHG